jgi:uncharacterized membrane protein
VSVVRSIQWRTLTVGSHRWSLDALFLPLGFSLVALLLGTFQLGRRDFTYDETISASTIGNASEYLRRLQSDEFNAAYYVLLQGWSAVVGSDEAALRSLSVVAGAVAVGLFFLLAERLGGRAVAVPATGLLAMNSFLVRHEQLARSYAIAMLLVVLGCLLFVRALERGTWRRRLAYVAVGSASLYAHFFAAYVIAAQAVHLLVRRSFDRAWLVVFGLLGVAMLPLLWVAFFTESHWDWIPATGLEELVWVARSLAGAIGSGPDAILLTAGYGLFAGLGGWVLVTRRATGAGHDARLAATWLFVAAGLAGLVSLWKPSLVNRYFIVVLPALVLVATVGLMAVRPAWLRRTALIGAFALAGLGLWRYYTEPYQDWRGAVAQLERELRDGDRIVTLPESRVHVLAWYGPPKLDAQLLPLPSLTAGHSRVWSVLESVDSDAARGLLRHIEHDLGHRLVRDHQAGSLHVLVWTGAR